MADHIVIVDNQYDWKHHFPKLPVVSAQDYISKNDYYSSVCCPLRVLNFCSSYRYLSFGYYCSLLAATRNHRVLPNINTLNSLSNNLVYSIDIDDISDQVHQIIRKKSRAGVTATVIEFDVYFGQCASKELQNVARQLFNIFRVPILRAECQLFQEQWRIVQIRARYIQSLLVDQEQMFILGLSNYLSRRWRQPRIRRNINYKYDLAILYNPKDWNDKYDKLQGIIKIGREFGINVELIEQHDSGRLTEFDALFIGTTGISSQVYQLARDAENEGLIVINSPDSLLKCNNKVYLRELLSNHRIRIPSFFYFSKEEILDDTVLMQLNYPVLIGIPDYSLNTTSLVVQNGPELITAANELFRYSALLLVQDIQFGNLWRIGILNRSLLFAYCFNSTSTNPIVSQHIISNDNKNMLKEKEVPDSITKIAIKTANLVGQGFLNIDLLQTINAVVVKDISNDPYLIFNNNDITLQEEIYRKIITEFLYRLDHRKNR